MMIDPLPLNVPRFDYVSVAPYFVTLEWYINDAPTTVVMHGALDDALRLNFHPSCPIGEDLSPDRRLVVDARGVTVFGYVEDVRADVRIVMTSECITALREIAPDADFELFALETMFHQ